MFIVKCHSFNWEAVRNIDGAKFVSPNLVVAEIQKKPQLNDLTLNTR
jgi:hypothetical protein